MAIEEEIKELNEQKDLLESEIEDRENWMGEDAAISFIGRHPKELLQGFAFSEAADLNDMDGYEDLESLEAYWKKAQRILELYADNAEKPHYDLVKAVEMTNTDEEISNAFITSLCEIIRDHFKAYYQNDGLTSTGQFIMTPIALGRTEGYGAAGIEYQRWVNEKNKAEVELAAVDLRINNQ